MSDNAEPWVGLVHVKPLSGNQALRGALGAYVSVLALGCDEKDYLTRAVQQACCHLHDSTSAGNRFHPRVGNRASSPDWASEQFPGVSVLLRFLWEGEFHGVPFSTGQIG